MSEWIKLYAGAFTHPKTRRLAKRLGITSAAAVGHLACLWSFTSEFAPDGDLSRFDDEEVEVGAGWEGADGYFVSAALAVGYLEGKPGALSVHDWSDYGGKLAERKLSERERSAERRAKYKRTAVDRSTTAGRPLADREIDREREREEKTIVESDDDSTTDDAALIGELVSESDTDASFAAFWSAYPNKQGKVPASRAWRRMNKRDRAAAIEVATAMAYCVQCGYRERGLCPHGSTFLHQRRWDEWMNEDGELRAPPGYGPQNGHGESVGSRIDRVAARYASEHEGSMS